MPQDTLIHSSYNPDTFKAGPNLLMLYCIAILVRGVGEKAADFTFCCEKDLAFCSVLDLVIH